MPATDLRDTDTGARHHRDFDALALGRAANLSAGDPQARNLLGADTPPNVSHTPLADPQLRTRLVVLTLGARWLIVLLGALVALQSSSRTGDLVAISVLSCIALALTVNHLRQDSVMIQTPMVVAEILCCGGALALSGGLTSPFVLAPAIPIMLAGFVLTDKQAVVLAYTALVATAGLSFVQRGEDAAQRSAALVGVVYLLCGVLGVFTRRVVSDIGLQTVEALAEVNRLAQANELLVALHTVAQSMPSSLDLEEVISALRTRMHSTFDHSVLSLFVRNAATGQWHHELAEGVRTTSACSTGDLPAPMRAALEKPTAFTVSDYLVTDTQGVSAFARSGLYCALRARGQVVGLIAIEDDNGHRYDATASTSLDRIAPELALTLDNAVWFGRLRTLGAETERARIARDLHDRIAQSLAYVSFELEHMCSTDTPPVQHQLSGLREVIHDVVVELRDTLYDLRTSINAGDTLVGVTTQYLERFEARHHLTVAFTADERWSVPTTVEQELWRIVQEGLHNVVKHARADRVELQYQQSHGVAQIELRDNGCGFATKTVTSGQFGLMGMRERADAIGARLDIVSHPDRGTSVRVWVEVPA